MLEERLRGAGRKLVEVGERVVGEGESVLRFETPAASKVMEGGLSTVGLNMMPSRAGSIWAPSMLDL